MLRRTAYTWTVRYDDPLMANVVLEGVARAMQLWLDARPNMFSDGWIGGTDLGVLQVGITVTRRDRWECQRRAKEFARALAVTAHVRLAMVNNPDPANLAPHDHRGRKRFLAPKYQEVTDGPNPA